MNYDELLSLLPLRSKITSASLSSASLLEDLLREFIKRPNYKWEELPEKVGIRKKKRAVGLGLGGGVGSMKLISKNECDPTHFIFSCYIVLGGMIMHISPYCSSFFLPKEKVPVPNGPPSLAKQVAVQMNDTHPTIAVAEMMRLLVPQRRAQSAVNKWLDFLRVFLVYTAEV